jgi:FG-GAP-like repeat/FG-GAP repeat
MRWTLSSWFIVFVGIEAMAQGGLFAVPPHYSTAIGPLAIAAGDFNGDGKLDLAVVNYCPVSGCGVPNGVVSILLGNGDGTFQMHVDYPVGNFPGSMAVGDFNGDGKLDLVVANENSDTVSVLFGNGDGTFQAKVDYGTAGEPSSVAVGDFNGDGKPDLAVTNFGASSVSVFLNSGTGTFPARSDLAVDSAPYSVVVGDFNNDGTMDLATAECNSDCESPGAVSILLGNGDGTFRARVDYDVGIQPISITAADLNGDGFLDLAVANFGGEPGGIPVGGNVTVLWGNGTGTFTMQSFTAGNQPSSVVVGDFNGDGGLDFAVTDQSDETISVFINQGNSNFAQPTIFYGAGGAAIAAVTGDFNGDGKLDLAVVCELVNMGGVCVLLGNGDGSFSPTNLSYPTGPDPDGIDVADLNGDGKNDVAVADSNDNNVSVFIGNGDGTVQPRVNYNTGSGPSAVAIADLNQDAHPDLVVANQTDSTVSVLLNNGNGTFQPHVDYATANGPSAVAVGDLDGDGKVDLAVACKSSSQVSVLFGNGDGTFQAHTDYGASGAASIALGDFNGDGSLDFAVVGGDTVTIFLNNGSGAFGSTSIPLIKGARRSSKPDIITTSFAAIAVADLNGDGKLDLAVSGAGNDNTASLEILLGNGDGTFQTPVSYSSSTGDSLAVADFNGDGFLDLALGSTGFLGIALGNGDGTFRPTVQYATGSSASVAAAADLNGDGKPDLAVANGGTVASSNTLTVLLSTGQVARSFKLGVSPAAGTVDAGDSANFTVEATTSNGFSNSVSLTCTVPSSTCTVSPASVIPTASGAATTVTVTTGATTPVGAYTVAIIGMSGSEQFTANAALTVNPPVPDFTVSAPSSPTPGSVTPGQSATAAVTVSPSDGLSGAVAFNCSVSPTPMLAPTCALNPGQAQVTGGGQVTTTLTINTTGPTALLTRPTLGASRAVYVIMVPVFGLALVGIGLRSDSGRGQKLLRFAIWCLLFGGLIFSAACGGGSNKSPGTAGTPSGAYTITVTASAGAIQHGASLTLTVQ